MTSLIRCLVALVVSLLTLFPVSDPVSAQASRAVTNSGPFNGTVHTVQDRSGNVIAGADRATGVVSREYIWLTGAGYAGTDLPVGVVDVAGTATPELLYGHADHLSRPIWLTDCQSVLDG